MPARRGRHLGTPSGRPDRRTHAPQSLKELAEVEILRQVWEQQFVRNPDGELRARDPKERPEAAYCIESPYETEVRYFTKRGRRWIGYKVHLTESCDEELPHLITGLHTTPATVTDVKQLLSIQEELAQSGVLPAEQLADAAYVCASNLLSSREKHRIDLIGPTYQDHTWQAKADEGFDVTNFRVDWENKIVSCPEGG